jgi:hypothetical protein
MTHLPRPRREGGATPNEEPDWDVRVLDRPVILDVPDRLPADPDPLLAAAVRAMAATVFGDPAAPDRVAELGRAGVVALRTSAGSFELRESLAGWLLVRAWGDPDLADLAAAARLRAVRLAGERRRGCGDPPSDETRGTP